MPEQTVDKEYVDKIESERREEARLHEMQISENYRKLLEGVTPSRETQPVRPSFEQAARPSFEQPVRPSYEAPERPPMVRREIGADNQARIESYHMPPASAKRGLFEDITSLNGMYTQAPAESAAMSQPIRDDEPTPFTMSHRSEEAVREYEEEFEADEPRVSFFAALSSGMKALLAAVAVAVIVAVMIVCINTGVLGSVRAEVTNKQLELDRLARTYRQVQQRIKDATDPDNIDEWARQSGMVRE